MTPLKWFLPFLLVANALSSAVTTMLAKGRPVRGPRSDAALGYLSVRSILFLMIFARLLTPMPESVHEGFTAKEASAQRRMKHDKAHKRSPKSWKLAAGTWRIGMSIINVKYFETKHTKY